MMVLLDHNMTPKKRFMPESMQLNLEERNSTATITVGPEAPELTINDWVKDETEPGAGIVWRVKTVTESIETATRTISLEHVVQYLKDRILFGEVTPKTITGNKNATKCTARQAAAYAMGKQSLWQLGDLDASASNPYNFNGDTVYAALETITSSLPDMQWEYDLRALPFTLHIRKQPTGFQSEMRLRRNITTMKVQIDRTRMYTRMYPIGKNNLHIDGNYVSKNDRVWGVVCKVETESSKDDKEDLKNWALERLERHCEPLVTVTVAGLELSGATGEPLDHITVGRRCRIPLPDYGTVMTERVVKMSWADKIKEPEKVTVTLANQMEDVASIVNSMNSSSGGGSRRQAQKDEEDHAWFLDTTTHVGMVAEAVAGPGAAENWSRVSSVIVDGQGIHQRVVKTEGEVVSIWAAIEVLEDKIRMEVSSAKSDMFAKIEITASSIRLEVTAAKSTLYSVIMQTATNIYTEVGNTKSDMYSKIEQTASSIRSEVETSKSTLYSVIMQTATNIYTEVGNTKSDMYSKIEQTASSIRSEVETSKSTLYSVIMQTATNIYTQVGNAKSDTYSKIEQTASSIRSEVASDKSSLYSAIIQTSTQIHISVENAKSATFSSIKANADAITLKVGKGEVISCINQTAESITISASKINLSGYVKATDLTADWLSAKIADLSMVTMRAATVTGSLYVSTGQQSQNVTAAIWDLWLVDNQDNTYTLKRKRMSDSAWVDVGTFSRAATVKVSGSWSGRTFTVSADDNGTTLPKSGIVYDGIVYDTQGQTTVSGKTVYHDFIVYADDGNGDAGAQIMKKSCGIDATAVYNNGWDYGLSQRTMWGRDATSSEQAIKSLSYGEKWTVGFTFTKANGTTEESKYTLQAPAAQTIPAIQGVWLGTQYSGVYWNAYAHTSDGVDHGPVYCDCTAPYNQGVIDAYASLSDAGVARSADYASYSQQTLSTITSNGNYYYRLRVRDTGGNTRFTYYYTLPVSVADSNPEQHHYQYALKCTDAVNESGSIKYTFTMQSSTNFAKGTTYTFWR